ncbi:MAG TPA: hypothetical protein PKM95_13255, partial [Deltaproteobacteria bacterium]|nr:hypothetical protein [Deltaproteobacteria bacterium]
MIEQTDTPLRGIGSLSKAASPLMGIVSEMLPGRPFMASRIGERCQKCNSLPEKSAYGMKTL